MLGQICHRHEIMARIMNADSICSMPASSRRDLIPFHMAPDTMGERSYRVYEIPISVF